MEPPQFLEGRAQVDETFLQDHVLDHLPEEAKDAEFSWLEAGLDSYGLRLGPFAVRFPWDAHALEKLRREEKLTTALRGTTGLEISQPRLVEGQFPFTWHRMIPGDHLTPEVYATLDENQRADLAAKLAGFFATLHALGAEEGRAMGLAPDPWFHELSSREKVEASLKRHDARDLLATMERVFDDYHAFMTKLSPDWVCYLDAHGWNMAFDVKNGSLTGLYDFADAVFWDYQIDFAALSLITTDLMRRCIAAYRQQTGRPVDWHFVVISALYIRFVDIADKDYDGNEAAVAERIDWTRQMSRDWGLA